MLQYRENLGFESSPMISMRDRDFAALSTRLMSLIPFPPTLQGLNDAIDKRRVFPVDRPLLVDVLKKQYQTFSDPPATFQPLDRLLEEDCFTVVTAHQPSLALGPLYMVYKTLSAIKLAREIEESNQVKIIPVFVMGGEDHDFEEISTTHIDGHDITWNSGRQQGSVGRMKTIGLREVWEQIKSILPASPYAEEILDILDLWNRHHVYGRSVQEIMHRLFGHYGLVVLNMDDPHLKRRFIPVMQKEIQERPSRALVEETQSMLQAWGYSAQAMPRELNLFYLGDGERRRLEYEENHYKLVDSDLSWNLDQILEELHESPQHFSPNVVMRPLYQEYCLPNIAYVGGGGELAYWQERQTQFSHFGVFFPVLIRRDSFLILSDKSASHLTQSKVELEDLFQDDNNFAHTFAERQKNSSLNLESEIALIEDTFTLLAARLGAYDHSLEYSVESSKTATLKQLDRLERKLNKAIRAKNEVLLRRLQKVREEVYPRSKFQERYESFLTFYVRYGRQFFDSLLEHSAPLDMSIKVLQEPHAVLVSEDTQ